jgi:predicted DsbA family dithiol-disulfide isomerase
VVERLKAEHGAEVEWRPFYLRPDTPPDGMELPAHLRARYAGTSERLRHIARANGMEMVTPSRIPNTRLAHEATEYAREQGKGEDFHRIVFRKYYGEGQDIGRWEVLRGAAQEADLDADEMQRVVEAGRYAGAVKEQVEEAYSLGITGVPTYVLNDRYAIVGAQPYEVFLEALRQIEEEHG